MIGRIIGMVSILAVALALWGLWRQVSKPRPLSKWTPVIGLVMAPLALLVNVVILQQANPDLLGVMLGVGGLGFGLAWGQAARLEADGTRVLATRSVVHLACWAASYAATQLMVSFANAGWVAGGLTMMFFAAGTTIGTNANLWFRHRRIRHHLA